MNLVSIYIFKYVKCLYCGYIMERKHAYVNFRNGSIGHKMCIMAYDAKQKLQENKT